MSKIEAAKQMGRTLQGLLTKFVLQRGRKPNNLEMILLKREAAQTGIEERKIISMVDRQPVNPDEPIMGGQNLKKEFISETDDEIIARLKKGNEDSLNRLKNKKDKPDDMATGGRAGYYGGGITNMVGEDLSEIGHGSDSLMARNMQLAPNSMATTSTGLNYLLGQDNDTARVPYNKGKTVKEVADKGRRGFMKAAGSIGAGIAALKTGVLGFADKAAPVVEKVAEAAGEVPTHFLKLVEKITKLGEDITQFGALSERQIVKKFKDFEMTTDTATGKIEIIKIKPNAPGSDNFGNGLTEEVYMSRTPGEQVLDKNGKYIKSLDEYEEGTAYIRNDGPQTGDVYEEVSGVTDDIFKEVGEKIPEAIRKGQADGGRTGYASGKKVFGEFVINKSIKAILKSKNKIAEAMENIFPSGDYKLDAEMVAESIVELNPKPFKNMLYDDLDDVTRSEIYGAALSGVNQQNALLLKMKRASRPEKTLKGIENTGTIDISDPGIADEFTRFMKETAPEDYKNLEQKLQLENFNPKKTKGNAKGGRITYSSGGLAAMLGE